MTYHPADILKTALFFATKTENHYMRLTKFAEYIENTKPEDVIASEYLLVQGLRFTFDVRHPFRALEGAVMDLQALSRGEVPVLPEGGETNEEKLDERLDGKPKNMEKRVRVAHSTAREHLKTSALLTDVYFHFTPSQIMMAALIIADRELTEWYIKCKLSAAAENPQKVLDTVERCSDLLREVKPSSQPLASERKELQALAKKLKKCRNPEKVDLHRLQQAKREGTGDEDKIVKKRKLEGEQSANEREDVFGREIKTSQIED